MKAEEMLERTRTQMLSIIEAPTVDPTVRVQAAGVLVKSLRTGEPVENGPKIKRILNELNQALR